MLAPPGYNHPARVAERIATLDLISDGRVDWGTGESASRVELEGFGIDPEQKKAMWAEAVEQTANMMAMSPYPGFQGKFFSMPVRNVVPKPLAEAASADLGRLLPSRETIHAAARAGIGALTFAFVDPAEAGKWAHEYYDIIKSDECVPIGHAVNANVAMVTGFSVPRGSRAEARRRGSEGFQFFGYSLGHYYVYGHHQPGVDRRLGALRGGQGQAAAGRAGQRHRHAGRATEHLRAYQDAGVDQVVFIQQGGRNKHEHICESLEPVRRQGDAGAEGRPGGARCEEAGRAGAVHRGGAQAQEADGAGRARRRARRSRPTAAPSCRPTRPPKARPTISPPTSR